MISPDTSATSATSLFARLGGAAAIDAAVEEFYLRVLVDPLLVGFFAKTNMVRMKKQQKDFFTTALGGPAVYKGSDMKRAHARFPIQEKHFGQVAQHLAGTLKSLGVSQSLISEVMAAVGPLAADIINTPEIQSAPVLKAPRTMKTTTPKTNRIAAVLTNSPATPKRPTASRSAAADAPDRGHLADL